MTESGQMHAIVNPHGITCQELAAIVTDYLDGALPEPDRQQFEAHIDACDGCRFHLEQIETTIRVVGRLGEADFSPEARNRLLKAFRGWKRAGV